MFFRRAKDEEKKSTALKAAETAAGMVVLLGPAELDGLDATVDGLLAAVEARLAAEGLRLRSDH